MKYHGVQDVGDELERVKQELSHALNIDLRSPAQLEQAAEDTAHAEKKAKQDAEKAADDELRRLAAENRAAVNASEQQLKNAQKTK